jgi:hypothetical protein
VHHPTTRRRHGIIASVSDEPRQIYKSVRQPRGVRGAFATRARAITVTALSIVVLAALVVAIITLA